jgi:hypothetical protein
MLEVDSWIADTGHDDGKCLEYDGSSLYAGLDTSPAEIYEINRSDMSEAASYTAPSGQNDCAFLHYDGTTLFAGLNNLPGWVLLFGGVIIKYLVTAAIDTPNARAYFGSYVSPGVSAKIDLGSFALDDSLTFDSGDEYPRCSVCLPSNNVFYGLNLLPGRMVDVEIPGFTQDSNQIFAGGQDSFNGAVKDAVDGLAYFTCRVSPGKIVRISLADYTVNATLSLATGDNLPGPIGLDHGDDYAFAGLWTSPAEIVVIRLSNFHRESRFTIPERFRRRTTEVTISSTSRSCRIMSPQNSFLSSGFQSLDVDNALDLHVNLDNVYVVIDHNNDVDLHVDLDDVDL